MRKSPFPLVFSVAAMLSLTSPGLHIARAEPAGASSEEAASPVPPLGASTAGGQSCAIEKESALTAEKELELVLRHIQQAEAAEGENEDLVILNNGSSRSYDAPLTLEHILLELRDQTRAP